MHVPVPAELVLGFGMYRDLHFVLLVIGYRAQEPLFLELINLTTGQNLKLTCHEFLGGGDGGAAPMHVEIGKDNARNPTRIYSEG